ncbi:peroxynitrite isomerase THAP4 isoform X2 [Hyla sarda]|uniref:peroxynitrite isomerase THAP4 isoform X2 n=1 Tax=Hyla sarda TaxID=327740 RepID=UPI0024C2F8D1|nr:peroxynitrite isomerase THAP4 isoform X2 [Hyla sarda]
MGMSKWIYRDPVFPLKDSVRLYLWTAAMQRSDWIPGPYSFLCSEHFSEDSFVPRMPDQHPLLRPDAVPSLFNGAREIKRKRAFQPHVLRLKKRNTSVFSLEDNTLYVSPDEDFVGKSDTYDVTNRSDAMDSRHLLHPGSQHTASKFIFSLHSYSRSSETPSSTNIENSDSSLHLLEEGAKHPHERHNKDNNKLSPSCEHRSGNNMITVEGSQESFVSNNTVLASIEQVTNSEVLVSPAYVVQKPIPGNQIQYPSTEKDLEALNTFDFVHSYCNTAKSLPSQSEQCGTEELTARSEGEELQGAPPLNPAVAPLAWMLGTWVSDPPGEGEFPSIPSFRYKEEAVISHAGQPMLNFMFCASNPETGKPMHRECGFIRMKPGTKQVAFICAQNTGVVEVEEGEVQGEQLTLTSHSLSRISFAKEPHVQQISRIFRLTAEGKLEQIVSMATSTQAMTPHLRVTYKKVTS